MAEKKTGIDQALIRDLANILNETDLTEIEVEQEDLRIRVSRAGTTQYVQAPIAAPAYAVAAPGAPAAAAAPVGKVRNPDSVISAPMVGTVYMASAPGAAAFIQVGSVVKEGQTLLIIEAMKTMNQIPAPKSGTVTEILIKDGSPVEYGEALVVIE
ncbi:acetyl-CoA carboxylase biotin carboxyl carrier protein [Rhizobium lusitanum]|uniref:acetyl-CoA carboxylase biotin carboxyl carrier protein n=1 Tax=Rhizobium lusitanum TaxID=293958 RepID=UPI00161E6BB9|nr:acetyl-CoA carboxylase biotin carboxyl carrier protein [Rhizobium lusitanum]QND46848.1 acetyl-CoA carboxylase biotin carboxyl carrier protein [Rhizobium lusitanum]